MSLQFLQQLCHQKGILPAGYTAGNPVSLLYQLIILDRLCKGRPHRFSEPFYDASLDCSSLLRALLVLILLHEPLKTQTKISSPAAIQVCRINAMVLKQADNVPAVVSRMAHDQIALSPVKSGYAALRILFKLPLRNRERFRITAPQELLLAPDVKHHPLSTWSDQFLCLFDCHRLHLPCSALLYIYLLSALLSICLSCSAFRSAVLSAFHRRAEMSSGNKNQAENLFVPA